VDELSFRASGLRAHDEPRVLEQRGERVLREVGRGGEVRHVGHGLQQRGVARVDAPHPEARHAKVLGEAKHLPVGNPRRDESCESEEAGIRKQTAHATPSLRQDCSLHRWLHVRRESKGGVPRSWAMPPCQTQTARLSILTTCMRFAAAASDRRARSAACFSSNAALVNLAPSLHACIPHPRAYSDAKVANREIGVWHFVI
jgi:hypothetical protein